MVHVQRFASTSRQWQDLRENLELKPCPYCKITGILIRHGFLYGYDDQSTQRKTRRTQRIFCSNRSDRRGCGRTFSIWMANKFRRLCLTASTLWTFLSLAVAEGICWAIRALQSSLSGRTLHRIWKCFRRAQTTLRTALLSLCPPPDLVSHPPPPPMAQVLAHLETAFPADCPITAYQAEMQKSFL